MGKKAANSKKTVRFGNIEVDPALADKLDRRAKIDKALRINKQFRTARTQNKRGREKTNARHLKKHQFTKVPVSTGLLAIRKLLPKEIKEWQSETPRGTISAGYNQWSRDWHNEARTGVHGKMIHVPPNATRYSKYPFAPRK